MTPKSLYDGDKVFGGELEAVVVDERLTKISAMPLVGDFRSGK